jgi:glycosyltransferase involved in cell wall biosynthesis
MTAAQWPRKHAAETARPLRIVRMITRLNVGGPTRHVVWLTARLTPPDFDSLLVTGSVAPGEEDMSYFAAEHSVQSHVVSGMSRELAPRDLLLIWKMFRLLLRERPDIVHTHLAKAGSVGRIAALLYRWLAPGILLGKPRRLRLVHTYHGHMFHSYYGRAKTRFFLTIEKMLARITDRIVVISDQQLREIHGQFRVGKPEQFAVIPLGLDLAPFAAGSDRRSQLRTEIGATESDVVVGVIGRLTEIKNHSLFLRACAAIAGRGSQQSQRFVIIGDGHLRAQLEAEAASLGVSEHVVFLGSRRNLEDAYPALDIVALTSRNEGTPLALIEAMAAQRAVVATTVGGVIDLLGDVVATYDSGWAVHERGIGVRPNDADSFGRALLFLANAPELRAQLGNAGHDFVMNRYSIGRLVNDLRELYVMLDDRGLRPERPAVSDRH